MSFSVATASNLVHQSFHRQNTGATGGEVPHARVAARLLGRVDRKFSPVRPQVQRWSFSGFKTSKACHWGGTSAVARGSTTAPVTDRRRRKTARGGGGRRGGALARGGGGAGRGRGYAPPCPRCQLAEFQADDFEILRRVGRLAPQLEARGFDLDDDGDVPRPILRPAPSFINVYSAEFATERPADVKHDTVLLKEYSPGAKDLALREIKVHERLQNPDLSYAAGMQSTDEIPVLRLLGKFVAGGLDGQWEDESGPSDLDDDEVEVTKIIVRDKKGREYLLDVEGGSLGDEMGRRGERMGEDGVGSAGRDPVWDAIQGKKQEELPSFLRKWMEGQKERIMKPDGSPFGVNGAEDDGTRLWLVFSWGGEGSCTVEDFPALEEAPDFWDRWRPTVVKERRRRFMKAVMRSAVEALAFCHVRGVVHGAMGGSCLVLSSYDPRDYSTVHVKLANFGFATDLSLGIQELDKEVVRACEAMGANSPLKVAALCRRHDIRMLGLSLAELIFCTFGDFDPAEEPTAAAIQRLWDGVFELDVEKIRSYYEAEEASKEAIAFLDDDGLAGWELLLAMMGWGEGVEADKLLATARFLQPAPSKESKLSR